MDTLTHPELKRVKLSAFSGEAEAQWELGFICEDGGCDASGEVLVSPSPEQALRWYQAAAEQGHPQAQAALSRLLSGSEGVPPDFEKAIAWGRRAVAQGDASAAYNLGTIYRDLGKPKQAFAWYQRAATMGDNDALLQIGLCLLFGWGVQLDAVAARSAWERVIAGDPVASCQRSREDAQYWLALVSLLDGRHTKRSMEQIRSRLETANADEDHEQANALLNLIGKHRYMTAIATRA